MIAGAASRGGSGGGGGMFGGGSGGFGGRSGGPGGNGTQYTYADGRVEDDRINADELRGPTPRDDEDDGYSTPGAKVTSAKKRRPILPVGIKREEYQEKGVELTTAEDIAAGETTGALATAPAVTLPAEDDEHMFVDDEEKPRESEGKKPDNEVWTDFAPQPAKTVMVRNDEGVMVATTNIDEIARYKAAREKENEEAEQKKKDEAAKRLAAKQIKEEDQIKADLDRLASELHKNAVLESRYDENNEPHPDSLEGNLFLFQLPPVLPPLKVSRPPIPRTTDADFVKPEPNDDDIIMFDQPAVDLTNDTPQRDIKDEEIVDENQAKTEKPDPLYPPEGGYVGRLIVRKSGKVEMDWGGQTLDVVRGLETNFLNTAVLVDETTPIPKAGEPNGAAYSMGRIAGKFVLAPVWHDEEEWEVDPDELEGGGVRWDELQSGVEEGL